MIKKLALSNLLEDRSIGWDGWSLTLGVKSLELLQNLCRQKLLLEIIVLLVNLSIILTI